MSSKGKAKASRRAIATSSTSDLSQPSSVSPFSASESSLANQPQQSLISNSNSNSNSINSSNSISDSDRNSNSNNMSVAIQAPFEVFKNTSEQDVENWFDTFESWCLVNGWNDEKMVQALLVYLGTEDLKSFYRSLKDSQSVTRPFNWTNVKKAFIDKFKIVRKKQTLFNALISCKQNYLAKESVNDYTRRFLEISNKISTSTLSEKQKVGVYISNLDPRIRGKMSQTADDSCKEMCI